MFQSLRIFARKEFFLLVLLFVAFNPYRGRPLDTLSVSHGVASYGIDIALGLVHQGLFPCHSVRGYKLIDEYIHEHRKEIANQDLRDIFPKDLWPHSRQRHKWFVACDMGIVFLIVFLWKVTGLYTLGVIASLFQWIHVLASIGWFAMAATLKRPIFSFLTTAVFLWSPSMIKAVMGFSYYFPEPALALIATTLTYFFVLTPKSENKWTPFLFCFIAGAILALGAVVRSVIFIYAVPLLLLIFFFPRKRLFQKRVLLFGLLLISFVGVNRGIQKLIWTPDRLVVNQQESHLFWHMVWTGLGQFPNPYGFQWTSDETTSKFVSRINPSVVYGSVEYEGILRDYVLKTAKEHPLWFIGTLFRKLDYFSAVWSAFIPGFSATPRWIARCLFWIALVGFPTIAWRKKDDLAMFMIAPMSIGLSIPILINSSFFFFHLVGCFFVACALCYVGTARRSSHSRY